MRTALLLMMLGVLAGCRTGTVTSLPVEPGGYADAFTGVTEVLRAQGYELERVDARAGIITTRPLASSGVWTPWITSERTARDEIESSLHRQRRLAEVRFLGTQGDFRLTPDPLRLEVRVSVERVYQPGVRVTPASVRLRHVSEDPGLDLPRDEPVFAVSMRSDQAAAAYLTGLLAERMGIQLEPPRRRARPSWDTPD